MRKFLVVLATFIIMATIVFAGPSHAAPRRAVVVIAEGLSPQIVEFGTAYIKTAYETGTEVSFDALKASAKATNAPADAVAAMRGLLKTAAANGYKTGLVTTGDAAKIAALFYDTTEAEALSAPFNVLAGGGRASFKDTAAFTGAGNTALMTVESLDEEVKGRALALQSDADLSYALDRDIEKEAGLAELASFALQSLNDTEAPFLLVIHDTLLAKAIAAKDTPALMEQFRELDGIVADALGAREENPADFGIAVVATGSATAPRFTTELPNERSEAFYILSQLPMSYGGAGTSLQGADAAKLTAFATERYKGWKLSDENRKAILAGTMTPEAAIRASYEPALKISYETTPQQAMVHAINLGDDALAMLKTLAATKPVAQAPAAPELEIVEDAEPVAAPAAAPAAKM